MEKYMSLTLFSSLDKLVENLWNEAFKYTKQEFNVEEFTLMRKKGVYILMTSWTVLKSLIKENCLRRGFLYFVEQGEYNGLEVLTCWKSLGNVCCKNNGRLSRTLSKIRHPFSHRCVREFQKDLSAILQIRSMLLFYKSRAIGGCNVESEKDKTWADC